MDNLQNIFGTLAKKLKIPKIYRYDLSELWRQVAGDIIAKISFPEFVEDGIFTIAVQDPVWINQLNLLKNEFIRRINEINKDNDIRDIKFRIGRAKNPALKKSETFVYNLDRVKLDQSDLNFIEENIKVIKDKELKEIVRNVFICSLKRQYLSEKKEEE